MKKIYLLFLLIAVFGFNLANAVPCPQSAIITNGGANLIISYPTGTAPSCGSPASVTVNGTTTYDTPVCFGDLVIFTYSLGTVLSDSGTLEIDTGFDTPCNYTDSVLPISDFTLLNATLKVYPNPLMKDNNLNIKLATNISAKINLYDLTGKLALSSEINNASSKQINTTSLTNGVYLLRMVTETTIITRKVVIMK